MLFRSLKLSLKKKNLSLSLSLPFVGFYVFTILFMDLESALWGYVSLLLVAVQIHVNFFSLDLPWTGSNLNSFALKCLDLKVGLMLFLSLMCGFDSNICNFLWEFCSLSTYTNVFFFPLHFDCNNQILLLLSFISKKKKKSFLYSYCSILS